MIKLNSEDNTNLKNIKYKQVGTWRDRENFKEVSIHPCYSEEAHYKFARMHLPVAPRCNIQCNYCSWLCDCPNESRPGVSSEVLTPLEALANEETFETLKFIRLKFPDLILCLSTNGLLLPKKIDLLQKAKITYLTITINAIEPAIGKNIYSWVHYQGKKYYGEEGFSLLSFQQMKGLREAVDRGMVVKVNTVMIPGINENHIDTIAKVVRRMGVSLMNIIPMIPVKNSKFAHQKSPAVNERKRLQDACEPIIKQIRHCRLCRADAIGFLGKDRCQEFNNFR